MNIKTNRKINIVKTLKVVEHSFDNSIYIANYINKNFWEIGSKLDKSIKIITDSAPKKLKKLFLFILQISETIPVPLKHAVSLCFEKSQSGKKSEVVHWYFLDLYIDINPIINVIYPIRGRFHY